MYGTSYSRREQANDSFLSSDADAVVVCLATTVATSLILCTSPLLFDTGFSPLVIPGGLIAVISFGLYMEAGPREEEDLPKDQQLDLCSPSSVRKSLVDVLFKVRIILNTLGFTLLDRSDSNADFVCG